MLWRKGPPEKPFLLQNLLWLLLFCVPLAAGGYQGCAWYNRRYCGGSKMVELANVIGPYALPCFTQVIVYAREGQNQRVLGSSTQADPPETPDMPRIQQDWI